MAEKKTYLIVQSVLCVLLCVLLAASAVFGYTGILASQFMADALSALLAGAILLKT